MKRDEIKKNAYNLLGENEYGESFKVIKNNTIFKLSEVAEFFGYSKKLQTEIFIKTCNCSYAKRNGNQLFFIYKKDKVFTYLYYNFKTKNWVQNYFIENFVQENFEKDIFSILDFVEF